MNIYPEQLRQIHEYLKALDEADVRIGLPVGDGLQIDLDIIVKDESNAILGSIVDEIGGAWSFEPRKP